MRTIRIFLRVVYFRRFAHVNHQLERGLFVQTFDIYCYSCHHQVHTVGRACKALVDISKCISIYSTERVGRNNAQSNLVGDHDERLVWSQEVHRFEQCPYFLL